MCTENILKEESDSIKNYIFVCKNENVKQTLLNNYKQIKECNIQICDYIPDNHVIALDNTKPITFKHNDFTVKQDKDDPMTVNINRREDV